MGLKRIFHNDIDELVESFTSAQREIAPEIELRLQIGLSRHCPISYLEDCLSYFGEIKIFIRLICMGMNSRSRLKILKEFTEGQKRRITPESPCWRMGNRERYQNGSRRIGA